MAKPTEPQFEYDVCLSFAEEQRNYVEEVAAALKAKGVRVFFDDYEKSKLWGKDLYAHLDEVYQNLARYCILFASTDYARKIWTNHERRSAQARAVKAKGEYILPARFDDTPIPGLPDTVHYLDLRCLSASEVARLTAEKVGTHERFNYLPPAPNRLFERLGIGNDPEAQEDARGQAWDFLKTLERMSEEERIIVLRTLLFGCPVDLPDNVHIHIDFLRRLTGKSEARLKRVLGGLRSLGFFCTVRDSTASERTNHGELGHSEMLELVWHDLSDDSGYPALLVAREMVTGATEDYCEKHGWDFLRRLDFAQLASSTATTEQHAPAPPKHTRARTPSASRKTTPSARAKPPTSPRKTTPQKKLGARQGTVRK